MKSAIREALQVKRHVRVEVPVEYRAELNAQWGCEVIACQLVDFKVDWFGMLIESTHDTVILSDGRQLVNGGDGFIKDRMDITEL